MKIWEKLGKIDHFFCFRDKSRHRSRSRDRQADWGRGGVASVGLHDEPPRERPRSKHDSRRDRDRDRDRGFDRKNRDFNRR